MKVTLYNNTSEESQAIESGKLSIFSPDHHTECYDTGDVSKAVKLEDNAFPFGPIPPEGKIELSCHVKFLSPVSHPITLTAKYNCLKHDTFSTYSFKVNVLTPLKPVFSVFDSQLRLIHFTDSNFNPQNFFLFVRSKLFYR